MAEITFTGNVGKDPVLEFTRSGQARLTFSVADSKSKPDGNGGWEKLAEQWMRVTVWGQYAEHLAEHVTKGSRVKVYGEFYAREYEGKDGGKGVSLDVTADGVKVFPARNGSHQAQAPRTSPAPQDDPWATPSRDMTGASVGWGAQDDGVPF